jgi:GAF domain-containing protein
MTDVPQLRIANTANNGNTGTACPRNRSVLDYDTEAALLEALQGVHISPRVVVPSRNEEPASTVTIPPQPTTLQVTESASATHVTDWIMPDHPTSSDRTRQTPEHEAARLLVLRSYEILDSSRDDPAFDAITREVQERFQVPWACLSLIDLGRQCRKSMVGDGLSPRDTPRRDTFCGHTILDPSGLLVVPDATLDPLYRHKPAVQGSMALRFYAGCAVTTPEGYRLGALCLLDRQPRPQGLNADDQRDLRTFADRVVLELVARRNRLQTGRKRSASLAQDIKLPFGSIPTAPSSTTASETDSSGTGSDHGTSPPDSPPLRRDENKRSRVDLQALQHAIVPDTAPIMPAVSSSKTHGPPCASKLCTDLMIPRPTPNVLLPDPQTSGVDPDTYLVQLVEALWGAKLVVKPALELENFFPVISEDQMAAYNMTVVNLARNNQVDQLRTYYQQHGRAVLDCFNRFGEGLLNMACRRGFVDMVQFLLEDVGLSVRVRDDYGRTPLHDACWNPTPQLAIGTWITQRDPVLFLIADKRSYTAFQYARQSDWAVWRQFLWDQRECLHGLTAPHVLAQFSA